MPTLTPRTDANLPPRVEVTFDDSELDPDVDTITVLQTSSAGEFGVRNAIRRSAVGGFFVVDYEVPVGVEVTYRAAQFDVDGLALGLTGGASTQIDIPINDVLLSDPLAPAIWVTVLAEEGFASSLQRERDSTLYRRGLDTVALMGEFGLLEKVPLTIITRTPEQVTIVEELLNLGTVLVRTMPEIPTPSILHVAIASETRTPVNARLLRTDVIWPLVGDEVTRSLLDVIVPVRTYQRYMDYYATYTAAMADYSTYLDSIQDPPPEA